MKRAYADTSHGQVHYLTEGSGPTLLLMHASNHSSRTFTELIPLLSDRYQVVAPDYLGFGNSDPLPDDISIPELAANMVEVLGHVGAESAHVFGLHTGNKIGAAMGARMKDTVDSLVICGQCHSIIPDEAERDAVIRERVSDSIPEYPVTGEGSHYLKEWADLYRRITDTWWDRSILSSEGVTEEQIDLIARQVIEKLQMRKSLKTIYGANFAYDWSDDLREIESPTLILELASQDEIETYGKQGGHVEELVPDSSWITLNGVDASVFYESAQTISDLFIDYFCQ